MLRKFFHHFLGYTGLFVSHGHTWSDARKALSAYFLCCIFFWLVLCPNDSRLTTAISFALYTVQPKVFISRS